MAQSNTFLYSLQIVPLNPPIAPGGFVCSDTPLTLSFELRARALATSLAAGNQNYGIMRAGNGPAGQTSSFIAVTDSVTSTRLLRGVVNPAGPGGFPLTGRAERFRSGGPVNDLTASPWHSVDQNGPGSTAFPSGTGNQFGAFDFNGDRLYGFDAYAGGLRTGESNPWLADFPVTPIGQFTPWTTLYRFDVRIENATSRRAVTINAAAFLQAGVATSEVFGSWPMRLVQGTSVPAAQYSIQFCPSPSAATMCGLGLCVAARRRRAR